MTSDGIGIGMGKETGHLFVFVMPHHVKPACRTPMGMGIAIGVEI